MPKDETETAKEAEEFEIDTNDGPESDDQEEDQEGTPVDDIDLNGDEIIGEGGNVFIDNNATQ